MARKQTMRIGELPCRLISYHKAALISAVIELSLKVVYHLDHPPNIAANP